MKLGTENRSKLIIAILLIAVALVLLGRFLFPAVGASRAASAQPSVPGVAGPAAVASRRGAGGRKLDTTPRPLDPALRFDWLKASEDTKYAGVGRNIFRAEAEPPKPVAPAVTDKPAQVMPPPPPPPPPINLKFFGFASKPGEPKKVFLSQGEDIFIAGEGEIVNRRYRIVRIGPASVEVEDVLNNNRQSIPLTQG